MPPEKLKLYPHFDGPISAKKATKLACDPAAVARHEFLPLLLFTEKKRYFRKAGTPHRPPKSRPLRYAARADAYIYMRYRDWLSCLYEQRLAELGLGDVVVAYRRIHRDKGGNKSNVDVAYEAIEKIRAMGDCTAICIDIKSFFESLDHQVLRRAWQDLLDTDTLPPDHYRVFKSVTKYVEADRTEVYRKLGFWGLLDKPGRHELAEGFLVPEEELPTRLCDMPTMRRIVFDGDRATRIAKVRQEAFGIPQGTPISDILANIYMMGFDQEVTAMVGSMGGFYMRYSDDILIVLPGNGGLPHDAIVERLETVLLSHGDRLVVATEKTTVHRFMRDGQVLACHPLHPSTLHKAFEYLGFSFDGRKILIRNSTLSRLRQRIARSTRSEARRVVESSRGASLDQICAGYDHRILYERFGSIREFSNNVPKKSWTFRTYVKRIADVLGDEAKEVHRQVRRQKRWIRSAFARHVEEAMTNSGPRSSAKAATSRAT